MQKRFVARKAVSLFISALLSVAGLVGIQTAAHAVGGISLASQNITLPYSSEEARSTNPVYYYEYQATANGTLTADSCDSDGNSSVTVWTVTAGGRLVDGTTTQSDLTQVALKTSPISTCTSNDESGTYTVASGTWYYIKVSTGGNSVLKTAISFSSGSGGGGSYTQLDKVTICHRTHSTTNPYVMITISASAIVTADGTKNGHGWHNPDKNRYNTTTYGPYDSTKTYKGNNKLWGDIIPPFEDATTHGQFAGLNWDSAWGSPTPGSGTTFSKADFRTVTVGGTDPNQSAVTACKGTDTTKDSRTQKEILKELFKTERGGGGQKRDDILEEIAEDEGTTPEELKKDLELPEKEGPKSFPPNEIAQSLSGVVWLDINRNGFQEDNEPYMANIKVTVEKGSSGLAIGTPVKGAPMAGFGAGAKVLSDKFGANKFTTAVDFGINQISAVVGGFRNLFGFATTYTVYTDKNGYYIFKSLESGDWYASGVVPNGLDVTYDSSGINDSTVDATVPVGGHAHTWIGLMGDASTGINSPLKNPDGTPVTKSVVITGAGPDGKFCDTNDVNFVITPVNGVITLSGIPAGNYYVRQIGSTATIADFTIVSGQTYSSTIKTKAGTRCSVLATTGGGSSVPLGAIAIALVLAGGVVYRVGTRRS